MTLPPLQGGGSLKEELSVTDELIKRRASWAMPVLRWIGLLKSTDDESFDQCVSCLSGKMTRKSLPHRLGRATDLLGIIHTDVCDPLRHVSRQMENQLGKTIKALRSDRGGEYISQEFKDYLKANGIVQQLTPPYTPQHNGVSESRNRTLLDMVQSMMNLTTLSLSFWDYALESATRNLNMVPTKKVDNTSYELWYGKVHNLSYLKVWGCEALDKRDTPDKLEQRSVKCIFIGYPKETMDPQGYLKYLIDKCYTNIEEYESRDHGEPIKDALLNFEFDCEVIMSFLKEKKNLSGNVLGIVVSCRMQDDLTTLFTEKYEEINLLGDGTEKPEFGEWSWMSPEVVECAGDFKKLVYKEVIDAFCRLLCVPDQG
ncbi:retrotransposon protein, putative, ty1-copia subclass [Tanacetum coccineum]